MTITVTSVLVPCLPRPVVRQVAGGGTTLPLRKTMTNLTSVTVSTADAAFLPLPLPPAPPSLCFPGCLPQPQAPWLLLLDLHPTLHACCLSKGTTSCCCCCCHSPTQVFLHEEEASPGGLLPLAVPPWWLSSGSLSLSLCLLKIHPLFLSLFQRVTNKSITQNPPTKVLGSFGFSCFPFISSCLSCPR